jgi:hypothetical protein
MHANIYVRTLMHRMYAGCVRDNASIKSNSDFLNTPLTVTYATHALKLSRAITV